MNKVLRLYIRTLLEKKDLLVEPDENPERDDSTEDEASVAANVAGVSTPLGTDSTYPKKKKKNKKRTPQQSLAASFANAELAFKK